MVLEGVDDDVGLNSFTDDAFRLKVLQPFVAQISGLFLNFEYNVKSSV